MDANFSSIQPSLINVHMILFHLNFSKSLSTLSTFLANRVPLVTPYDVDIKFSL